jgi:hypothetical protein
MNGGGDFIGAMAWGVRKYFAVLLVFIVALGVLIPLAVNRGADTYEAQAQVGPTDKLLLPNLDPLPRLGESVFNNGAVADAVRADLGLPHKADVTPKYVELVAAQDNIVFTVIGRNSDKKVAQRLANLAASTFTIELNKYSLSVGKFQLQRGAVLPGKPVAKLGGGYLSIGIGLLAGLIAGLGVIALLLVWRRPVLDASSAEEATNAPVLGRVRLPRGRGEAPARDYRGLAQLCRRVLGNPHEAILLVSPPKGTPQLRRLGTAMTSLLASLQRMRPATGSTAPSGLAPEDRAGSNGVAPGQPRLLVAEGTSLEQMATLPDTALTLLVVPEGIGLRALREAASEYFTGGPGGLVFVSTDKRRRSKAPRKGAPVDSDASTATTREQHPVGRR